MDASVGGMVPVVAGLGGPPSLPYTRLFGMSSPLERGGGAPRQSRADLVDVLRPNAFGIPRRCRTDPGADRRLVVPKILSALENGDDTVRILAAEAVDLRGVLSDHRGSSLRERVLRGLPDLRVWGLTPRERRGGDDRAASRSCEAPCAIGLDGDQPEVFVTLSIMRPPSGEISGRFKLEQW